MKAEFLILQVCGFIEDLGDGYYKWHEPGRQLSRLPGVVFVDAHPDHHLLPDLTRDADVVILPYYQQRDFQPMIEDRRARGKATVFDASDYIYDVEIWSPFGAMCQDRSVQEEFRQYIRLADAVQTTTDELARRWAPWARKVAVFHHHLGEIPPLKKKGSGTFCRNGPSGASHKRVLTPSPPLTIGLSGSRSHYGDWYDLAPALERWVREHPGVRLSVMANEFAKPFFQLPAEQYQFKHFSSLPAYLEYLTTLDIGLAPLLPTDFNRCRSDVKFLEYASRGVVGVYADLEPYRGTVRQGETGFLYKDARELLQYLDVLAGDAALRERIRGQAYEYVAKERRIEDHVGERLEFFRGLVRGRTGCEIPEEALGAMKAQGNYLQLRPGGPEGVLQSAGQKPSKEAAEKLARLVEQYPKYLVGLQRLGRMLNEMGDYMGALGCLERALAVEARSAWTLSEMSRARYGMRDVAGARQCLEAALEINPAFHPAWQYLLRLGMQHKTADVRGWVERARQAYPGCYLLALAGARAYADRDAILELRRLLDLFAPTFGAQAPPEAAAAFSRAIMEVAGRYIGRPEVLELLRRACEAFPQSARLADMFGHALHLDGKEAESHAEYERALAIRRAAQNYQAEYAKEAESVTYWQVAEHIVRA